MDNLINIGLDTLQTNLSFKRIIFNLFFALIFSALVVKLYLRKYRGYGQPYQMCLSLVICSVVTAAIIMVVGGNIALSLGLVGALSIVRFRTPIKDSRDLAYLFWAICIGLGSGGGGHIIVICLSLVLGGAIFFLEGSTKWAARYADYILVVTGTEDTSGLLNALPKNTTLKSMTSNDNVSISTFTITEPAGGIGAIVELLKKRPGVSDVQLVSPDYDVLG